MYNFLKQKGKIYIYTHILKYIMEQITTIRLKKSTKEEFVKLKNHPRETDEDLVVRLIKEKKE